MVTERRLKGLLGIAYMSRNVSFGDQVVKSLQGGRAFLVLISDQASDNTRHKYQEKSYYYQVPCFVIADALLNQALGKQGIKVISVDNPQFAKKIIQEGGNHFGN